jgi:hypothetical protein
MKRFIYLILFSFLLTCAFADSIDMNRVRIDSSLRQAQFSFLRGNNQNGFRWLAHCREELPQDSVLACVMIDYWQAYGYYQIGKPSEADGWIQQGLSCWERFRRPGYKYNLDLLILQYQIAYSLKQTELCHSIYQTIQQFGATSKEDGGSFYFEQQPIFQLVKICHQQGNDDLAMYFIRGSTTKLMPSLTYETELFPRAPGYYIFLHETALSYLYYVCHDLPHAQEHLKLAKKYENLIGSIDEEDYLQQTLSFIALLIHYDSKQYRLCKQDMEAIYGVRYRRFSELQYSLYGSPLTPEDWNKLLQIEKERPVYNPKNPFSSHN